MPLRRNYSTGDLSYSAFEEVEDCFNALERSRNEDPYMNDGSSMSLNESIMSSRRGSVTSMSSGGSNGSDKDERKARRRRTKSRADMVRQKLANAQEVKRNVRSMRRSSSAKSLQDLADEVVKEDTDRVNESLRVMEQIVVQYTHARTKPRRSRSTGRSIMHC